METTKTRTCVGPCAQDLPFPSAFAKNGRDADGSQKYRGACRECDAAKTRRRRTDPGVRAQDSAAATQWRADNPNAARAHGRKANAKYRATERGRATRQAYDRKWVSDNPEKNREKANRRRARKTAATVEPFTTADLHAFWDEAGYHACYWCDCAFTGSVMMHVDHLVPLSRGGAHTVENLVPACSDCNLSKNAKDPYAYALERYPWLAAES